MISGTEAEPVEIGICDISCNHADEYVVEHEEHAELFFEVAKRTGVNNEDY